MPENNHRLTKGTYTIYTFGCQMNVRESQTAQGILEQEGYVQALSAEQADVILFNTCCIRELAEQKAWTAIGATKEDKREKSECNRWRFRLYDGRGRQRKGAQKKISFCGFCIGNQFSARFAGGAA